MGKVATGLSMSLDGFIAGPNDGPERPLGAGGDRLFAWYQSGDTDVRVPSGTLTFKVSPASAELLRETFGAVGALVTGGGRSTSPTRGVAGIRWTCRFSS